MKVYQLIMKLEEHDGDADVFMAYPSGDYWRTIIAGKIDTVESCQVKWSDYHSKFVLPKEGKDPEEDGKEAVVLI
jgi:hypothetical protein